MALNPSYRLSVAHIHKGPKSLLNQERRSEIQGSSIEFMDKERVFNRTQTAQEQPAENHHQPWGLADQPKALFLWSSPRSLWIHVWIRKNDRAWNGQRSCKGRMPEGNCPARKQERLRLALPVCSLGPPKKPLTCSIPSSTSKTPILTKMGLFKEQMRSFVKSVL